MKSSPKQFGQLLSQILRLIAARQDKKLQVLQDDISFDVGRESDSFIRHLRKGNAPGNIEDLEKLGEALFKRDGFKDQQEYEKFLRYGGHPNVRSVAKGSHEQDNTEIERIIEADQLPLKNFVAGPPITEPSQFFGRQHELTHIFSRWSAYPLEHIAIIGPRRSGKTSLLHHVNAMILPTPSVLRPEQKATWLPPDRQLHSILIDFQDIRMRRLESLFTYVLESLGLPVPTACDLDQFVECVVDSNLPRPTVILMDNILLGLRAEALDMDFWYSLRSLVSNRKGGNLAYMITAPELPARVARQMGKDSPFFNIFQLLELGALKEAETRELIESSPIQFDRADKEWILLQGKCWPHPTQLMCQTLYERLARGESTDGWRDEASNLLGPFRDTE